MQDQPENPHPSLSQVSTVNHCKGQRQLGLRTEAVRLWDPLQGEVLKPAVLSKGAEITA